MSDNEIKREQPSFEVRAESLKKRTKEFFSTYENPNGSEDRLEICLIREGYRAVLMAEEEINRQQAELEDARIGVKSYKGKYKSAVKTAKELITVIAEKQAEIERLSNSAKQWEETAKDLLLSKEKAKAEAIKEFAELVDKDIEEKLSDSIKEQNPHLYLIHQIVKDRLKEMVGEQE